MKRKAITAVLLTAIIVSMLGSAVFAADTANTAETAVTVDGSVVTVVVSASMNTQEFSWTVSASEDVEYTCTVNSEFESFVSSNGGILDSGVQYDGKSVICGGVLSEAQEYTGEVMTVTFTATESGTVSLYTNESDTAQTYSYEIADVVYGDVDSDEDVDVSDALLILQAYVGLTTLDDTQTAAADVNSDGEVTVADALLVLQHYVGLITTFPAEA